MLMKTPEIFEYFLHWIFFQILKKTSTEEIRDEEDQFFSKGIYSHLLPRLGVRRLQEFLNRCQFHQHFETFLYKSALDTFSLITIWLNDFCQKNSGAKATYVCIK
jgi:hypothetical protein